MTLVLLPGLSCDAASWQPVAARLHGVDCIVPALPAHGSLGESAREIAPLLPIQFALAGHSMGGRVALELMRRVPERVTHLALFDTGFRPLPDGEAGDRERAHRYELLAIAREEGMRAMGRRWTEPMVHPSRLSDVALMEAILDMIGRSTPERFAREIEALLARPDASDVLAAVRCPTLVACGREDRWADVAQHREMAERIAGSRMVVVDVCGHMAPMERPDAVAAAIREWLARPRKERGGMLRSERKVVQ